MTESNSSIELNDPKLWNKIRDRIARGLGIQESRRVDLYAELSQSASIADGSYWLQVIFAAGIATLGLVLNSPAVIIGAMLISPLMGPILSGGLAFAAGDLILGIRTGLKLALSCLAAILFALLLVAVLPFKEITAEILGRTRPNTLDLGVALFSGAIGSLATCKEVKGIATSIPGVAIAVALMPPLCVVGYGLGIAVSLDVSLGWFVASGGGLLFLTNLVAITFTAMIVFAMLHIDSLAARKHMLRLRREDPESLAIQRRLDALPAVRWLQKLGTLSGRLLAMAVILALILIPLTQSLGQLKEEILEKQSENKLKQTVQALWQSGFARLPDGQPRSFISMTTVEDRGDRVSVTLNVFSSKPYTDDERNAFRRQLAQQLSRPVESVELLLVEIPTSSSELLTRRIEEPQAEEQPSVATLHSRLRAALADVLSSFHLPKPAQLLDCQAVTGSEEALMIRLVYLSDRDVSDDARGLIEDNLRQRLRVPTANVVFERVDEVEGPFACVRNQSTLSPDATVALDRIGKALTAHEKLRVEISAGAELSERKGIAEARSAAAVEYLRAQWRIAPERIGQAASKEANRDVSVRLTFQAETLP